MPVEIGVWRVDKNDKVEPAQFIALDLEARLEAILSNDISIVGPQWMVLGRQVRTSFDKIIDLLCIDRAGNLVVLELKRDKTYRDIVAQVLDYGSWVRNLRDDDIARIFTEYQKKYHPTEAAISIDEAFCKRFAVSNMPDELNGDHELVIVAASVDPSTERIVGYLAEQYGVNINAVFFRVFSDGDREYLARAWLREPSSLEASVGAAEEPTGEWNGEYYVSFGVDNRRCWEDAMKYGFISAGGGTWYSNTLHMLEPGARVWVNIPGRGYVGVGIVTKTAVPMEDFIVKNEAGQDVSIASVSTLVANNPTAKENPETAEYFVAVEWIKTVPMDKAIKEKGFFGNQNSVARPTSAKWNYTVERLKARIGIVG